MQQKQYNNLLLCSGLKSILLAAFAITGFNDANSQISWKKVDSLFQPLPASIHVYRSNDSLDGKPFVAFYVLTDLNDRKIACTTDTTFRRRLTPQDYFQRNSQPVVVVNTTFFSFATNQNLNIVIKKGKLTGYNIHTINGRGKDTFTYRHPFTGAIGISNKRKADIAWLYTDSAMKFAYAIESTLARPVADSCGYLDLKPLIRQKTLNGVPASLKDLQLKKWKMETAVGGGPVLLQEGIVRITNEEEMKFTGRGISDKHPRTAMGYTADNKLIILVVEGRNPGKSDGATLLQLAQIFKDLGCVEALNLDGGGSSCLLVNGKQTIKVSDPTGQRPVPAVFIIR